MTTKEKKMSKQERKARDADFARRLQPRKLWDSQTQGTYERKAHGPLPGHK